jgi:hypothetical protein
MADITHPAFQLAVQFLSLRKILNAPAADCPIRAAEMIVIMAVNLAGSQFAMLSSLAENQPMLMNCGSLYPSMESNVLIAR